MRMVQRLDEEAIAGNVFDKYNSRNPLVRQFMAGFDQGFSELLDQVPAPRNVLEVGCGEGHVTAKLVARYPDARVVGTDRSSEIIARARELHRGIEFQVLSIYDAADSGPWDLIVACEVFEHLAEPAQALEAVTRAAAGHVLVTVPREPVWRVLNMLRGRYWGALGNTPGHLQHWSSASLQRLLQTRLDVLDVRTPLPWTQVLARSRESRRT